MPQNQHGALMSLIAWGVQNAYIPRNIAYEYESWESESLSQSLLIPRRADIITPEYVQLNLVNPHASVEELKPSLSKLVLQMQIGANPMNNWPLGLLMDLETPDIIDGKLHLNLHFPSLFGELAQIGLGLHEVRFRFITEENLPLNNFTQQFSTFGIVGKLTYLDTEDRRQLSQSNLEHTIQQVSYLDVVPARTDLTQVSDTYKFLIPFDGPSKGFFIQCANASSIDKINLQLNGIDRYNYNKFLIKTKCKLISNTLLYVPFNIEKSWSDITAQSFIGSTNLSRIDSTIITIKLDTPIANLRLYGLGLNIYRQSGGVGAIAFGQDLYAKQIDFTTPLVLVEHISLTGQAQQIKPQVYLEPVSKPITNTDRKFCPLSFEDIHLGKQYMSCTQCNHNFSADIMKIWLGKKPPGLRSCPMCRTKWTNYAIYINGSEPDQINPVQVENLLNKVILAKHNLNQVESNQTEIVV